MQAIFLREVKLENERESSESKSNTQAQTPKNKQISIHTDKREIRLVQAKVAKGNESDLRLDPLYAGTENITDAENDIYLTQYLADADGNPLYLAFLADMHENIDFCDTQGYTILKEKLDGRMCFIVKEFTLRVEGDIDFFYTHTGKHADTGKHTDELCVIHLHIVPAIGSLAYREILHDLTRINIRLMYATRQNIAKRERIKLGFVDAQDTEIRQLEQSVSQLSKALDALNNNPMTDMTKKATTLPFRQVKHLDARVIMDHYVLHKPRVRTFVHEKTLNTYENQKVYSFLKLLARRIDELEANLEGIEKDLADSQATHRSATQLSRELKPARSLEEQKRTLKALKRRLMRALHLKMFGDDIEEQPVYPLRSSNMFVNHKHYREIFQLMRNYREVGELIERADTYCNYNRITEVYELWCYFKVLDILMTDEGYTVDKVSWPTKKKEPFVFEAWSQKDYASLSRAINTYLENVSTPNRMQRLEGIVIHLSRGNDDVYVGYNCTFWAHSATRLTTAENAERAQTENQVRPDIFLLFNKDTFFVCDAKYKSYKKSFQDISAWYADLFECAAHKYIYRLCYGSKMPLDTSKNPPDASESLLDTKPLNTSKKPTSTTPENATQDFLLITQRFRGADAVADQLKCGGVCILTPALADTPAPAYYNGENVKEYFETYLEFLAAGKVNKDSYMLDENEYKVKLKGDINEEQNSRYEYRIASTQFLPGHTKGFNTLFFEAIKYHQDHFLTASF